MQVWMEGRLGGWMHGWKEGEREGRKEGWRGKFLTRWCNSKDILRSKCVFQDRQSTMGPEHLHILAEVLESTVYLLLDAEPFLCRAK